MENKFYIIELVKSVNQFNKDWKTSETSVKALDNVRNLCFYVSQVFELDKNAKASLEEISWNAINLEDSFVPSADVTKLKDKINKIRFDLVLALKTAKIDFFN
jgi:hypothetical protein